MNETQTDLQFLEEMLARLERGRAGDASELEYLQTMLTDWRDELAKKLEAA